MSRTKRKTDDRGDVPPRRRRNDSAPAAWLRGGAGAHGSLGWDKKDRQGNRIRPEDIEEEEYE